MTDRPERRSGSASEETEPLRRRSFAILLALAVCATLAFAGFVALGTWQLQRLQWKLALIERVEQRVHAAPVPAPGPDRWPQINAEADEYRHVRVTGTFLHELATRVQATTELGSGYWLLTPLRSEDGTVVLVNRGFIPAKPTDSSERKRQDRHEVSTVSGLLRISEPGGGFLRNNDPAANRWHSRDVQAIAAARGLSRVAPYFVDADSAKDAANENSGALSPDRPIGGLTVISFHNNHLVYALTWYALALMVAGAGGWVAREERRIRRGADTRAGHVNQESEDDRKN
ncbi:SURF1 family protein [Noviherbaspirillum cavernae]|uniref:SURF1-like protein n=1 Tax=Noviherbaspirillum cavernae TaxID=2320862 RepID=A0A418X2A0_9BURK|nr:SURF1 family protein [Noviherbaspirillum cavernae]RJG06570.1 SURF1 family protein [Noviherbaspirillum cavernae]